MSRRTMIVAVALLSLAGGCLGERFVLEPADLYPPESIITNAYQPRDVPIPLGFEFQPKDSFAYVGAFRVAELRYIGEGLVERIAEFYEDQLPKHGWSYWRREGVYEITLVYVNDRNECRVSIRRLGNETYLRIRVIPRDVKPYGI